MWRCDAARFGVDGRDDWPSLPRIVGVDGREEELESSTLNLTREVMQEMHCVEDEYAP